MNSKTYLELTLLPRYLRMRHFNARRVKDFALVLVDKSLHILGVPKDEELSCR